MKHMLMLIVFGLLLVLNVSSQDFNSDQTAYELDRIRKLCIGLGILAGATQQQAGYVCVVGGKCWAPIVSRLALRTSSISSEIMGPVIQEYGRIAMQCYANACSYVLKATDMFGSVSKKAKILCQEFKKPGNTIQDFAKAAVMLLHDELEVAKQNNITIDMLNQLN